MATEQPIKAGRKAHHTVGRHIGKTLWWKYSGCTSISDGHTACVSPNFWPGLQRYPCKQEQRNAEKRTNTSLRLLEILSTNAVAFARAPMASDEVAWTPNDTWSTQSHINAQRGGTCVMPYEEPETTRNKCSWIKSSFRRLMVCSRNLPKTSKNVVWPTTAKELLNQILKVWNRTQKSLSCFKACSISRPRLRSISDY